MSTANEVLAANGAFYRAFEKKDLEAMAAVWSQGIGCLCVHPGRSVLKGWEAVGESWQQIFRSTQYLEIDTDIIQTEIVGDLAYVVLIEKILQVAGGRELRAKSIATNVFERMADRWVLIHHHGSPLVE